MNARPSIRFAFCAATLALATTFSTSAWADGFERRDTQRQYTAPLSQATQPSYVPQSVALSGPPTLAYHDDEPVPPGYTPVQRTRRGAIIAGAVVFGSLYLLSSFAAAANADSAGHGSSNELGALWVPVLGPFIMMGNTDSGAAKYAFAIDGLGQATGAALLVWGLTSSKTVLVRNDLTSAKPTVRAVPILSASTTGVGLAGTF